MKELSKIIIFIFIIDCSCIQGPEEFDIDGDGYTVSEGDCNDSDSAVYPDSLEICDGKDNDCDGTFDEGAEPDPSITEVLDGKDNDCDGEVDEDFSDDDGDGFSEYEGDCDDSNASVNPDEAEMCDDIDQDCNGSLCCEWFREIGESDIIQSLRSGIQLEGGSYIFGGYEFSDGSHAHAVLLKTDSNGYEEWRTTFGGNDGGTWINSLERTEENGYLLVGTTDAYGSTNYKGLLIKTDRNGAEEWHKTFGEYEDNYFMDSERTEDGGYILTGSTQSYGAGGSDVWLVKIDQSGDEEWSNTFGDIYSDSGSSVDQTNNGEYVIVGVKSLDWETQTSWVIKTNEYGEEEWNKILDFSDTASVIKSTEDGGSVIAGDTYNEEISLDIWLIKLDEYGNEEWAKIIEEAGDESLSSIEQTGDGGYLTVGTISYSGFYYDILVRKIDRFGNEEWMKIYEYDDMDNPNDFVLTGDGGLIIIGSTYSYISEDYNYLLVKTCLE